MTKDLVYFSSYYRTSETSGNILLGSASSFHNYCGTYKIISVTPKKLLKTEIFEKSNLMSVKNYLNIFDVIIEYEKPQGTIYKGPQRFLAFTVQAIRSIL